LIQVKLRDDRRRYLFHSILRTPQRRTIQQCGGWASRPPPSAGV